MEIWALNLPQFYEIAENNEWWEDGFTEWTNVKRAKPLYSGHYQPVVPLNNNYYNLSKKETIKWQFDLAKAYGVSCFVYFHYWYCGRMLLERPCEVLLTSNEIDGKYCFCWANHSWTRAWNGKEEDVLLKQNYGGVEEWERHLQYLLSFFQDSRYMRIDDKPVLFIYKPRHLDNADERINYWNSRLREYGIEGIFVIEYLSTFNHGSSLSTSQAVYEDEPNFSCRFNISIFNKCKRAICKKMKWTDYQNYDGLWNLILKKKNIYGDKKIFESGFPCWDNSPRKGKNSRIIRGASPEKFERYLKLLLKNQRKNRAGVIVINAWNEWGEGAMLEPTEKYAYQYLEAIRNALDSIE